MKIYRGHRDGSGVALIEVSLDATPVNTRIGYPLEHHVRHSPDGFEWGYGGSGPADTARCILIDYLGHDVPSLVYQQFKFLVIGELPPEFELNGDRIAQALEAIKVTTRVTCLRCGDRGWMHQGDALDVPEDGYCPCDEGQRMRREFEAEMSQR